MTTLTPIEDRLVIEPAKADSKSAGGIVLPDMAQDKPLRGKVRAVGEDAAPIKEGDEVLYSKYGGVEIEIDGEELLALRKADVLAILG